MGICFECRVTIDDVPQTKSCQTLCRDGMRLWGGLSSPPVGFQPAGPAESESAGRKARPTIHRNVIVVGAGPAGIAAACAATEGGLSAAIVDDNPAAGGQIWRGGIPVPWRDRVAGQEVIAGTVVAAVPAPGVLLAESAGATLELRFEKLILATGARERFLPFPGWTLPNVVGAGGLQALVKGGLPIENKRVVIAGGGPLLIAVVLYLRRQGAIVQYGPTWNPVAAEGNGKVEAAVLRRGRRIWREPCDYLACSFGLVANTELPLSCGCAARRGAIVTDDWQETSVDGIYYAGSPGGLGLALAEGAIAGHACAGRHAAARRLFGARARARWFKRSLDRIFPLREHWKSLATPDTIVCRCEDVTLGVLREHTGWRSAKLQSRCGMGPCQGRVCGPAVEFLLGWTPDSIRPPIFPVRVESLRCPS
jgi:NADPH-dependent 2,4-dienoyl-CoA reductase/sulfur reductase-like enzyme